MSRCEQEGQSDVPLAEQTREKERVSQDRVFEPTMQMDFHTEAVSLFKNINGKKKKKKEEEEDNSYSR